MKTSIKSFVAVAAVGLGMSFSAFAEKMYDWTASGSYAIGATKTITMPEAGEVYYKLSIKAGSQYTFVVNGAGASAEVVYTYKEDGDDWDETLASSQPDTRTEDQERCIVWSENWEYAYIVITDPDEKEYQVKPTGYYLHVIGDSEAEITLTSQTGAKEEPIPEGDPENPKVIAPTTVPQSFTGEFTQNGEFWVKFSAKVGTYLISSSKGTAETPVEIGFVTNGTGVAEYTFEDISKDVGDANNESYFLTVKKAGTVSFCVLGEGEEFGLTHQYAVDGSLGTLKVNIKGTEATWSLKGASGSYTNGQKIAVFGQQTVQFEKVSGFSTPADKIVTPTQLLPDVEILGVYNDSYDPKDDVIGGATKLTISAKINKALRTLFEEDDVDYFSFSASDGYYYNFALTDLEGDAVMAVFKKDAEADPVVSGVKKISALPLAKGNYYVKVYHASGEAVDSKYTLVYSSANVGVISFSKTAVSAKKSAGSVTLAVKRSAGEGKVRVRYGTVNDTAKPGVDYIAQQGELVWEDGDKKDKSIVIKLIPEFFAEEALTRQFKVELAALEDDVMEEDEYPATIAAGKGLAVVTVTEAKGKLPTAPKKATVKTETVPLETGTYQGVLVEDGSALTNGLPVLASVTFTAKSSTRNALSARVIIAGKTYTFSANTWDELSDDYAKAVLTCKQTVNRVAYVNELSITVNRGETGVAGDWRTSAASVELTMAIPDSNNKGVQEGIYYTGNLYRDNSKIQGYLDAVYDAVGYYTIALVPTGVSAADGIPAGNGYLTLTIDNKGKAKIAGMLSDGSTKPSYTSIVAIGDDGDALLVPVFISKSPYCFGGTLKLTLDKESGLYVVDSTESLRWNNDNALLSYEGEEGWRIIVEPVGGYFSTVGNLQNYYLTCATSFQTVSAADLLEEALASGYSYVTENAEPGDAKVSFVSDALSTDKRTIVKSGKLTDFAKSVNPCNVQAKLTRATGLVTGSFSVWTENADGTAQKEITNLKHNGILLLSRAASCSLDPDVVSAGFFNQSATLTYYIGKSKKTRKYTASLPFNILAVDQGEPDWYADDWGERDED